MKADFVVTEDKAEVVTAAWGSFQRAEFHDDQIKRLAAHKTKNEMFETGWKMGFYFALVALEEGALGSIKRPEQVGDN